MKLVCRWPPEPNMRRQSSPANLVHADDFCWAVVRMEQSLFGKYLKWVIRMNENDQVSSWNYQSIVSRNFGRKLTWNHLVRCICQQKRHRNSNENQKISNNLNHHVRINPFTSANARHVVTTQIHRKYKQKQKVLELEKVFIFIIENSFIF